MTSSTGGATAHQESVWVQTWVLFVLVAFLATILGAMTGTALTGALQGGDAVLFYVTMSIGAMIGLFILFNFTVLRIAVNGQQIEFRYGLLGKRFDFQQVRSVETARYDWKRYGGWGLRYTFGGRRAWSVPFVKTGVVMDVDENGNRREYFISSHRADDLVQALSAAGVRRRSKSEDPSLSSG